MVLSLKALYFTTSYERDQPLQAILEWLRDLLLMLNKQYIEEVQKQKKPEGKLHKLLPLDLDLWLLLNYMKQLFF